MEDGRGGGWGAGENGENGKRGGKVVGWGGFLSEAFGRGGGGCRLVLQKCFVINGIGKWRMVILRSYGL